MLNHPNNEIIKIAILEVSNQSKSVLEFYFSTVGKSLYKEVRQDEATAFITDYDYPGAVEHWEEISKTTNKPGIILSISEKNVASTVWLAKPLSAKAMTDAATTIRNMLVTGTAVAESVAPEVAIAKVSHETIEQPHMIQDEFVESFEAEKQSTAKQEKPLKELEMAGTAEDFFSADVVDNSENYDTGLEVKQDESADNNFSIAEEHPEPEVEIVSEQNVISIDKFKDTSEESQETSELIESVESDEIDSLLESLILGEGRKKKPVDESDKPASEFTSTESDLIDEIQNKTQELKTEIDLKDDEFASNEQLATVGDFLLGETAAPLKNITAEDSSAKDISLDDSLFFEDSLSVEDALPIEDSLPIKDTLAGEKEISSLEKALNEPELDHSTDKNKSKDYFDFTSLETSYDEPEKTVEDKPEIKNADVVENLLADSDESDFLDFEFESILSGQTQKNKRIEDDGTTLDLANHRDSDDDFSESITETELFIEKPSNANMIDEDDVNDILTDPDEFLDHMHELIPDDSDIEKTAVPLSAEQELQSLLNEIRVEADKGAIGVKSNSSKFKFSSNSTPSQNQRTQAHEPTNAEKRWDQLCGEKNDVKKSQNSKRMSYTLNKHMLSILLDQIDRARGSKHVLRLKHDDIIIVIDTELDSIYSNYTVDTDEYVNFCYETVNPENIKVHALDYSEVRLYRKKMETKLQNTHSIESFIWTTSLLTSRGRLLDNTDTTKPISLKTWPNLTRLESIPYAMNIAAVFSKHPGSLQDVPKWLNIPHRYVYAFYNGALALEMVEFDSNKFKASKFDFNNNHANSNKERSFFSRLLKRLTA